MAPSLQAVLMPAHFIDFHRVFVTYARDQIKGPIHLNTKVTKIGTYFIFPIFIQMLESDIYRPIRRLSSAVL